MDTQIQETGTAKHVDAPKLKKQAHATSGLECPSMTLKRSQLARVWSGVATLLALILVGCSKSESTPDTSSSRTPLASNTVLRVHWVGKRKLGIAASAYALMRIWNQPESKRVEDYVVEKLAMAPWKSWTESQESFTAPIPALQEIINDVLNEECWCEIRSDEANDQAILGVRLSKERGDNFAASLADVLSSLTGTYPSRGPTGWTLQKADSTLSFELVRVRDWVLVGKASSSNQLLQEITARVLSGQDPYTTISNEYWLEINAEARWLAKQINLSAHASMDLPHISLRVSGNGAQVITEGEFLFAKPLACQIEAWAFPKELVKGETVRFAAIRGFKPWLEGVELWKTLNLGESPNQAFLWSDSENPFWGTHLAVPTEHADELMRKLGDSLPQHVNQWLTNSAMGNVRSIYDNQGLIWSDLPMISPYIRATNDSLLIGGMHPNPPPSTNSLPQIYPRPSSTELLAALNNNTNLVAFEWETTGECAESAHILGQVLRVIARQQQMPAGTLSSQWLERMRPRLGNTTTWLTLKAPNQLTVKRTSTIGLNATELHIVADWMESPNFPFGFYSTQEPVVASPQITAPLQEEHR